MRRLTFKMILKRSLSHFKKLESLADVQNELDKAQNEIDHLTSVTKNDRDLIDGLQVTFTPSLYLYL